MQTLTGGKYILETVLGFLRLFVMPLASSLYLIAIGVFMTDLSVDAFWTPVRTYRLVTPVCDPSRADNSHRQGKCIGEH